MIIKKSYIEKLIKEEIHKAVYGDDKRRQIIHLFINAINDGNVEKLINGLKNINILPYMALDMLNRNQIDNNFYIKSCQLHNEIVKTLKAGKEKGIDAFAHFPQIDHNPDIDQDPSFMRKPKSDTAYDQEDTRKHRKNLTKA